MNTHNWVDCVGVGWATIVEELVVLCMAEQVEIHQVKEKFGGLRFYIGPAPDHVYKAIEEAEAKSILTCEMCGRPGKRRELSWIKTLCNECAA